MIKIGKYNRLPVVKTVDFGVYLDGGNGVEILLPARYVTEPVQPRAMNWKCSFIPIRRTG